MGTHRSARISAGDQAVCAASDAVIDHGQLGDGGTLGRPLAADDGLTLRMRDPGVVPDSAEVARRLTAEALVAELFTRFDARDVDAALALYTEDATVFQAHGRDAVRSVMERGMSPSRGRHLITNLRAWSLDTDRTVVEYTAAAFTLEGDGPFAARSVFDHRQIQRREPGGVWRIAEHEIHGYTPPA